MDDSGNYNFRVKVYATDINLGVFTVHADYRALLILYVMVGNWAVILFKFMDAWKILAVGTLGYSTVVVYMYMQYVAM